MSAVQGSLVRVCEENPNLVCFVSLNEEQKVCRNALVLVCGIGEGFMTLEYTEKLSQALLAVNYSLVMINLSSSWYQFGFRSLASDCEELEKHLTFLKTRFEFEKFALLGHSTGAQDALYFMRHAKPDVTCLVNGIILQGGVSDREAMTLEPFASLVPPMLDEAKKNKGDAILSDRLLGAPITAYRLLSLAGKLTDDDMFSTDLTEDELHPIFRCVTVPVFLCYSEQDEYIPDHDAQKKLAQRIVDVLKKYTSRVECRYYTGNHGLSKPQYYQPFVDDVVKFVDSI